MPAAATRDTPRAILCALALGLALAAGGPSGCGGGGTAGAGGESAAAAADWAALEQAKQDLDRKREQMAGAAPAGEARERLAQEVGTEADELNRRLVELLNADPPVEGEPMSERQLATLRMKSDEDIVLAREYIEQGGDYRRAIEIYEQALAVDPGNPRLREELAKARASRYVTEERFSQVKEGMSPAEVRQVLGAPNPRNVREYPEQTVVAWFYPKDESGAAAGVWFKARDGALAVYEADFSAIEPAGPAGEEMPGAGGAGPDSPSLETES